MSLLTIYPLPTPVRETTLASRWQSMPPHSYSLDADLLAARLPAKVLFTKDFAERPAANDVSSRFGRRLREMRRSRDMTQVDMARRFGIDRSFISDVERGRKSISLPMLEIIALGLSMSLSDLFRDL